MSVKAYFTNDGKKFWRVDTWLKGPGGGRRRFRESRIPTKEQATALENKMLTQAFEGRWFSRPKPFSVKEAWEAYEPVTKKHNRSWQADVGRAKHVVEHLGAVQVSELKQHHVDNYLKTRSQEKSRRGRPPADTTLFKEVSLLRRFVNFAVNDHDLRVNPFKSINLKHVDNVRQFVLHEVDFGRLLGKADAWFRLPLLLGYDCGMRRGEILELQWSMVDLKNNSIRLPASITKTQKPRTVPLTDRAAAELRRAPRSIRGYVITNPRTDERRYDFRKAFAKACDGASIEGLWFHDLRRSYVTNARRRGVEESVVRKVTGHRTRAIFDRYDVVDDEDIQSAARRVAAGRDRELAAAGADTSK